jgi:hypothetical protein
LANKYKKLQKWGKKWHKEAKRHILYNRILKRRLTKNRKRTQDGLNILINVVGYVEHRQA